MPFVQAPVVRRDLRKDQKGVKKAFDELRQKVAAATGVEVPELEKLRRVSRRQAPHGARPAI